MRHNKYCESQKGVALLLSILALLLLSAIAVSMMYMSSTESAVNANFKAEETEYFAARAAIEEVRDRMIPGTAPYSINGLAAGPNPPCPVSPNCYLPTQLPTANNGQVVYLLQSAMTTDSVTNFASATGCPVGQAGCMVDDELCHDYAIGGMAKSVQPNVRCAALPGGNGGAWYSIPGAGIGANIGGVGLPANSPGVSAAPNWAVGATQNPLNWKWARITLKATNSTPYCVDGTTGVVCAAEAAQQVCWDGVSEKPLAAANCAAMPTPANPVYLVTALAVTSTGARRLIQADLAQTPVNPTPGLFATGNGCGGPAGNPPVIPFVFGGNANTYSFNGAADGGVVPTTVNGLALTSGGNIGANGGISMLGTSSTVNGTVSSTLPPGTAGPCPASSVTINGGGKITGTPQTAQLATPFTEAVPAIPNNVPTSTCDNASPCWNVNGKKKGTLSPGTYGNISLSGGTTLTLQGGTAASPAIFNINSLSVQGNSTIVVTGPVILNFAGNNIGNNAVIDFTGGSLTNTTNIPSNLVINYGGSGTFNTATVPATANPTIVINGGGGVFASINAPNSNLKFTGGGNFYGAAVAETIDDQGGTNFYWDTSLNNTPNTSPYVEVSMRELAY
jgi:Tfp pilus assembly protein PilX